MRKFLLVCALVGLGLFPIAASAQQAAPPAAPQVTQMLDGVDLNKVLAIGAGVVVGAVLFEAFALGDAFVLVGGVAGGLVGAWWYDNSDDGLPRLTIRSTAVAVPATYQFARAN